MAESEEKLKSLLMRVKEESEKAGLKLNIKKLRSWHPVPSFMANRKSGSSDGFYFLGLQNHCGDCSHEIKRHLLLGRKAMTNLRQHFKKQRCYFADKGPYSQSIVFPAVIYRCESWTIKKAEYQRMDAFELWYWRRLSRVPWTVCRSN